MIDQRRVAERPDQGTCRRAALGLPERGDDRPIVPSLPRLRALGLLVAGLMTVIFVLDTVTRIEIAVPILYVVPILVTAAAGRKQGIWMVGLASTLLTLVSAVISSRGDVAAGGANGLLSLIAIGATTSLAARGVVAASASRQAQADLARLARVLTVNEVTTTIAHEVSQPLAAIIANGSAAKRWLTMPDGQAEAFRALERVCRDAERAGTVIDRVRRHVQRVPPVTVTVALATVVDEAIGLVRHHLDRQQIELRLHMPPDLPRILGDPVQLQQVVLNLLLNGIEALEHSNNSTRVLTVESSATGSSVRIEVRDTGVGFAEHSGTSLFEPFYTTKPHGIGVGLSISRSIIELHGGKVFAMPQPPSGAVVGFTLPVITNRSADDERD